MEDITEITQIKAPYGKIITINEVEYDNGFKVLRVRIKEGKRFTDMDLDVNTTQAISDVLASWLTEQPA